MPEPYWATPGGPSGKGDPEKRTGDYSLGPYDTACSAYDHLRLLRRGVEDLGRLMAELTIPSVYPKEGYLPGDNIPGNNQSMGAQCVNTLASKLMFLAMPPGRPMMKLEIIEENSDIALKEAPELYSMIELALSKLEQAHRRRASTTNLRSAYVGMMKLLLVAGNGCWRHLKVNFPTFHRPEKYVVQRDGDGNQLLVILKERVVVASMDADVKEFILAGDADLRKVPEWEAEVDIYSVCNLCTYSESGEKTWCYWQETEAGDMIPGTEVETDYDIPPLYAAWLIPVYGENWGRSYCEEYRGDLYTIENHAAAINDGAAAASLHLTFVKPGSRTSVKQIREAPNLSVLPGDAADVTTLKSEKNEDYQFVSNNFQAAAKRLSQAFLLMQSITRDAERVTAEEIQQMAAQLDEAMGGIYSELANSFQRHMVTRFVALHEEENHNLPPVNPNLVSVGVATGIDAVGRTVEGQALVQFGQTMQAIFGPLGVQALSLTDFARRLAAYEGVDPSGLVKDDSAQQAVVQQDQQNQAKQTLLEKGTGPAVKGMADMAQSGIDPAAMQSAMQAGAQNPALQQQMQQSVTLPAVQPTPQPPQQ